MLRARSMRLLSAAVLLAGGLGLASPSPAAAQLRTGMTWTVVGQQNGYVQVGYDNQTNAYAGDTTVDQYQSLLCVLVDGRTAPGGITFDYYSGWLRGAVQATAPVRGDVLTSQAAGDSLCAQTFGSGWRMAEFHDGRHGSGFSLQGGWSFWGQGKLTPGTRFWVAINDQPANPWNSAGSLPPAIVAPQDDLILKTRLQELAQPFLVFAQAPLFRDLVYTAVARRFDGDDNVLLSDLIWEAEQTQIVNPSSPEWIAFKAKVASFQNINGTTYYPQIFIPNYQDGALPTSTVTMVIYESDLSRTQLPAYQLDWNGDLTVNGTVDETFTETNEVWVLSINERVGLNEAPLTSVQTPNPLGDLVRKPRILKPTGSVNTKNLACNPTGLRNNMGLEYLVKFRVPDPSDVEHWTSGKLEVRAIVVGKGGAEIKNAYFGKIKRKTIKNWVQKDLFLTTWDRAVWGDYLAYKWVEEDNGPKIELSLKLSATIKILIDVSTGVDVKATFESKHDDMGAGVVGFTESTYIEYGTGTLDWTTCSVGGSGGTGNNNLAIGALAAASSSFPGYSPGRVNDGSQSTALGGGSSWANADASAPNGFLPQWVQLDFGTNRTFSRVVVYTSTGYPIRDYDIQVWNGLNWVTVASVNGNTALSVTTNFAPRTARLVRILGRSGPNHQPQYVRVNEFEVYQ